MTTSKLCSERVFSKAFAECGLAGVVKIEVLPVADGETLTLVFEASASPWRQGVWLRCDRGIDVNGVNNPSAALWSDTAPRSAAFTCRTSDGILMLYNVWDTGEGRGMQSQALSSGMRVEEVDSGRRYCCNDIGFQTRFDALVFRIERA